MLESLKFDNYTFYYDTDEESSKMWNISGSKYLTTEYQLGKDESNFYPIQKDWVILMAGGWIGLDTVLFAQKAKRVITLEPAEKTFSKLYKNCVENKVLNAILIRAGFSQRSEILDFQVIHSSIGSGIYNRYGDTLRYKEKNLFYSWDDFVDMYNLDKIDICKLDIEGSEFETLKGMTKCLPKRLMVAGYHPKSTIQEMTPLILSKDYIFDGIVKDGPSDHTYCYHLKE